jgi:TIR domain
MARIFVSYRRRDSAGHAGRLYDHLRDYFGSSRVFMDVEGIEPGTDFTEVLDERIARAEVVVAVVGPNWLPARAGGSGKSDRTEDYVFREIATALARGVEVIPVLVAGAAVPPQSELPDELADLTRRQMYAVNDTTFAASFIQLIRAVERSAARTRERRRLAPRPAIQIAKRLWTRLLLLYEPTRPAMWILHILFFFFFVTLLNALIIACFWILKREIFYLAIGLMGGVMLLIVAPCVLLTRGLVLILEPDEVLSRLRRWFLLYNPPRTIMTAVHFLFFVMLLVCFLTLPVTLLQIQYQTTDVGRILVVVGFLCLWVATFVIREIGAANDPLKSSLTEPTWFSRLLCIWKPRHGLAWLPRIVFYCCCGLFVVELAQTLLGDDGNFRKIDVAQNLGVFVLCATTLALIVSARGAARAIEVNWSGDYTQGTAQRVRRALLLYRPWRLAGWIPTALFWLAVAITTVGLAQPSALHWFGIPEGKAWILTTVSGLVAVCAWTWSGMYRPPSKWPQTNGRL